MRSNGLPIYTIKISKGMKIEELKVEPNGLIWIEQRVHTSKWQNKELSREYKMKVYINCNCLLV